MATPGDDVRNVYIVMPARAMDYGQLAIETLAARSVDRLDVVLITDTPADREEITRSLRAMNLGERHLWRVSDQAECNDLAAGTFKDYPHLRQFRLGHPCWRKVTDPLLFGGAAGERIVLDPDLYFPNPFRFELAPAGKLLLMWQRPHCLLPRETVERAYDVGVKLAHHTDIGVAHVPDLPLDWLDWLIGALGGADLPRKPHVESIVWAAAAMRIGGGYLNPAKWICWQNTIAKRVLMKAKMSGDRVIRLERLREAKVFHAGGVAKNWVVNAVRDGHLKGGGAPQDALSPILPFEELTRGAYEHRERVKARVKRFIPL